MSKADADEGEPTARVPQDDLRGWVAESRSWGWRHTPECEARKAAEGESPFFYGFVDDHRCTCYVLSLFRFEMGIAGAARPQEDPQP